MSVERFVPMGMNTQGDNAALFNSRLVLTAVNTFTPFEMSWTNLQSVYGITVSRYEVWRMQNAEGTWSMVGYTGGGVVTYTDSTPTSMRTYSYRIKAIVTLSAGTAEVWSNTISQFLFAAEVLSLTATIQAGGTVKLDWTSVSGQPADDYLIYRATAPSETPVEIGTVGAGVYTYTDSNTDTFDLSTSFNYWVKAKYDSGAFGELSNMATVAFGDLYVLQGLGVLMRYNVAGTGDPTTVSGPYLFDYEDRGQEGNGVMVEPNKIYVSNWGTLTQEYHLVDGANSSVKSVVKGFPNYGSDVVYSVSPYKVWRAAYAYCIRAVFNADFTAVTEVYSAAEGSPTTTANGQGGSLAPATPITGNMRAIKMATGGSQRYAFYDLTNFDTGVTPAGNFGTTSFMQEAKQHAVYDPGGTYWYIYMAEWDTGGGGANKIYVNKITRADNSVATNTVSMQAYFPYSGGNYHPRSCWIRGTQLFVTCDRAGMTVDVQASNSVAIFSLADPNTPAHLGTIALTNCRGTTRVINVVVVGNYAYIAYGMVWNPFGTNLYDNRISKWDISTPASPVEVWDQTLHDQSVVNSTYIDRSASAVAFENQAVGGRNVFVLGEEVS